MYTQGVDGEWGVAGANDDGLNGTDDVGEAGWLGSDDAAVSSHPRSVRILRYNPANPPAVPLPNFVVENPDSDTATRVCPRVGSRFLVNGRPLNGKGAGYLNAAPYTLNQTVLPPSNLAGESTALLPNYGLYTSTDVDLGGLDEPWDAVDYQNMYLAMVPPNVSDGIIPSFHRPALVNYWLNRMSTTILAGIPTLTGRVLRFGSHTARTGYRGMVMTQQGFHSPRSS